jgi:proteasome lid subunit RPN8/RPN11
MLKLKKELLERIVKHSLAEFPNEACGILSGSKEIVRKAYEMTNAEKSPETFFMDAREHLRVMKEIRGSGEEMIGIYHSHVASEAYPSSHDVELALYPEASYVIISIKDKKNPSIRSFKIVEGEIAEEELKIE